METRDLLMPIVMTLSSIPLFAIGFLLRYKKQMNLISGYDPEEYADPDGLANWAGGWCLGLGVFTTLTGGLFFFLKDYILPVVGGYCVVILAMCTVMMLGTHRFKKK